MSMGSKFCVLALDLSTVAGLAVITSDGTSKMVSHAEVVTFKKLKGWDRVNSIAARVMEMHANCKPDFVVIEAYAVGKFSGSAICSIEIGSIIRFLLWQNDIPFLEVSPTSLKKFVTGKGNAKKENMILEVFKRFGYTSATNDIADAVGLGMYGLCAAGVKFAQEPTKCVLDTLNARIGTPLPRLA